jgi:ribosomal protein L21E
MNFNGHIALAKPKKSKAVKMEKVMHEFKMGALHSGSKTGRVVTNRKQAVAIAMSEAKRRT